MDKPVYLDWAATAPLCKEAADAMAPYLQAGIDGLVAGNGNANSLYEVGRTAFRALEQAREDIARSIKARPDEMTFTSGATEADNAALFGIVDAAMARAEQEGDHECVPQIVVSSIEHDAVLKAAETLGHWGAQVTYVEPDSSGHITPDALEEVLTDRVLLVSVMAVNNEVGSVMDIPALAAVAHKAGALFHVDATQAFGKIPVSVKEWGVDALSISSHKIPHLRLRLWAVARSRGAEAALRTLWGQSGFPLPRVPRLLISTKAHSVCAPCVTNAMRAFLKIPR